MRWKVISSAILLYAPCLEAFNFLKVDLGIKKVEETADVL